MRIGERPRSWLWSLLALVLLLTPLHAAAGPPPEDEPAVGSDPSEAASRALLEQSAQVAAWLGGTLHPAIDPESLFALDLSTTRLTRGQLDLLRDSLAGQAPDPSRAGGGVQGEAVLALASAYAAVGGLPANERAARRELQATRHSDWAQQQHARAALEAQRAADVRAASRLEALVAGTLSVAVDAPRLLEVDLLAEPPRLDSPASGLESPELAALRQARAEAATTLARARGAVIDLGPERREELLQAHDERRRAARAAALAALEVHEPERVVREKISEAERDAQEARVAREAALEAAKSSRSERVRLAAEEKARLLGIKEAQSLSRAELSRQQAEIAVFEEQTLEWNRKVSELEEQVLLGTKQAADADALYEPVREDLASTREALRAILNGIATGESSIPAPPGAAPAGLDLSEQPDLAELRAKLIATDAELRAQETAARWSMANQLRDDMVMLNEDRLAILDLGTRDLRRRMTGLGPDGVRQVRREVDQIVLEARFQLLHLPVEMSELVDDLRTSPVPLLVALIKLVLAVVVFRWWRRRAEDVLERLRQPPEEDRKRPPSPTRARFVMLVWYVAQIRKPLEALALLAVVLSILEGINHVPDTQLIWLIGLWFLLGSTVVLWVDAIARRDSGEKGAQSSEVAALRISSLRVVSLTVVFAGLVSSIANAVVGRGAIYSWVLQLVWVMVIPLVLMLIAWWRVHIFRWIREERESGPFFDWVRSHESDWTSFPAAVAAGAYLLGRGLLRFGMRQAAALETTRRLLAYLFRREVARRAEAEQDDEDYAPIEAELVERMKQTDGDDWLVESLAVKELEATQKVLGTRQSTLSAVIGERGAGKTTFVQRLGQRLGDNPPLVHIKCPSGGFGALRVAMATELGVDPDADDDALLAAMRALAPEDGAVVIAVDNAHRLVRPAIGGMHELDAFTDFARKSGAGISWLATFGAAAWQYVSRARGERVFFDQIVVLPEANEAQIGELVRRRAKRAEIEPSYERLSVPRQFDDQGQDEATRVRQAFDRILWDYSDGNPAVARHFWGESLFRTSSGDVVVRLFKEHDATALDGLRPTILFVLRAIVQLDYADASALAECTQLPGSDVADALRFAMARGYVEEKNGIYRIVWPWYRAITRVLARQHLLVLPKR